MCLLRRNGNWVCCDDGCGGACCSILTVAFAAAVVAALAAATAVAVASFAGAGGAASVSDTDADTNAAFAIANAAIVAIDPGERQLPVRSQPSVLRRQWLVLPVLYFTPVGLHVQGQVQDTTS